MFRNRMRLRERLERLRGSSVLRDLRQFDAPLADVAALETDVQGLTEADLRAGALALRQEVGGGRPLDDLVPRAFALAREAARRTLGQRPFDEQVLAALALHQGAIVEMQTGEGKTLAAVMPAFLHALSGRGVHVLTFNDYLARRDAEWMGPAYRALGLSVGWVQEGLAAGERRRAYAADVTYVTAKEAGFDHLRDLLATDRGLLVHRPFHFALVDEADSLLVDEARVPLVIAGAVEGAESRAFELASVVALLDPGVHFDTDEHGRNVELTEAGFDRVEEALGGGDLLAPESYALLTELHCALHARALLRRDADYIVRDGRIELVDEFTGRVVRDRHWPDGLQAALEAKEGLERRPHGRILGSITLQHFLGLYPHLSGMTGTAQDAAPELDEFYGRPVVVVPTHRPIVREDGEDLIFTHREAKEAAVVEEVARTHAALRPVLVGTLTVEESERLASRLRARGVPCEVLNARHDALEAGIVAAAGAPGAVTLSTHMAGRGTDIRLGGPDERDRDQVVAAGGLYVIGTNRHESRRVDLQLRGRAGRQGDPGASRFFLSLEDDLLVRYGIGRLLPGRFRPARQDGAVDSVLVRREVGRAQRIVEGQNLEIRRTLWRYASAIEDKRRELHGRRQALLLGQVEPALWRQDAEGYGAVVRAAGPAAVREAETALTLFHMDRAWSEYLTFVADLREGIHLVGLGGDDPLTRFKVQAADAFRRMEADVEDEVHGRLGRLAAAPDGPDLSRLDTKGPSATWTYLINDDPFRQQLGARLMGPGKTTFAMGAAVFAMPLLILLGLADRFLRKRPRRR
ncbi:MAG TPA: accessory Sec system translocase SecA2 [Vicinamibacteria bacterium]|nr:accessory Sec system translocase SecA2 [Vicinamibacteria bacterium]